MAQIIRSNCCLVSVAQQYLNGRCLFYREIFEKYYHDQSRTIVDFWMPNKAWPGCNVNDPSARVLANYGASGV